MTVPRKTLALGVLPISAMTLALVIGWMKWQIAANYDASAGTNAVEAATKGVVAMLSYQPGTVDQDLTRAQNLLTGSFRDEYARLARDVVIPVAQQRRISSTAVVSGAAPVTASPDQAAVLAFVNQTTVAGDAQPKEENSSVRVELKKVGGRWLISAFDPV